MRRLEIEMIKTKIELFPLTNEVVVIVVLVFVEDIRAIITHIANSITILVSLIRIVHVRTVVLYVGDEVIVDVRVAHVPELVSVCVLLLRVAGKRVTCQDSKSRLT